MKPSVLIAVLSLLLSIALPGFAAPAKASKKKDNSNSIFIASVVQTPDYMMVLLNPRQHWITEQSLADGYSEEETRLADQITDKVSLCNLAESQYEPCREGRSVAQVKADLEKAGVEINAEFQTWSENELKKD